MAKVCSICNKRIKTVPWKIRIKAGSRNACSNCFDTWQSICYKTSVEETRAGLAYLDEKIMLCSDRAISEEYSELKAVVLQRMEGLDNDENETEGKQDTEINHNFQAPYIWNRTNDSDTIKIIAYR